MHIREDKRKTSAIIIQKLWRGYRTRTTFTELTANQLDSYKAHIVGNDPEIKLHDDSFDPREKHPERKALVITSCMRGILLACQYSNPKRPLPKIFLLDVSKEVHEFWDAMKVYIKKCRNVPSFMKGLEDFLIANKEIHTEIVPADASTKSRWTGTYDSTENFFQFLFTQYSFLHVKKLILKTTQIKQSCAHTDTMINIRNQIKSRGIKDENICVYLSNILHCMNAGRWEKSIDLTLNNLALLNPALVIHTDLVPEKIFYSQDNKPSSVKKLLKVSGLQFDYTTAGSVFLTMLTLLRLYSRPTIPHLLLSFFIMAITLQRVVSKASYKNLEVKSLKYPRRTIYRLEAKNDKTELKLSLGKSYRS